MDNMYVEFKMKVISGRCPKCGEIYRFYGSDTYCLICNTKIKEEEK